MILTESAKVWFQEKADIGKVLDMTDLEELNDDFVKSQLLRWPEYIAASKWACDNEMWYGQIASHVHLNQS